RVVGLEGVGRGHRAEFLLVGGDEGLVLRIVEVGRPVGAAKEAERGVLLRRQRRLVDREGGKERDVQPRLAKLLDEIHAHAAGRARCGGVSSGGGGRGQLGGAVQLVAAQGGGGGHFAA